MYISLPYLLHLFFLSLDLFLQLVNVLLELALSDEFLLVEGDDGDVGVAQPFAVHSAGPALLQTAQVLISTFSIILRHVIAPSILRHTAGELCRNNN